MAEETVERTSVGRRYVNTRWVSEYTGIPYWTLLERTRRYLIPPGVVVRIGKAVRWDRERLDAWLATGADMGGPAAPTAAPAPKRGRGRPRKHPGGVGGAGGHA